MYRPGKESVSTKNTSSNHTTTDMSMENKPLSQRKSFVQEKDKANKVFEIVQTEFRSSKTNTQIINATHTEGFHNFYEHSGRRKTQVADLIYSEGDLTRPQPASAPAPLPKNFKRIPAMIENLTKKEELLKKANEKAIRGRTESNHRIAAISNEPSQVRRGSSERPGNIKDYKIGRQIGKGAYAVVKLVTDRVSSELMAMKVYEKYKLTDPARRKSVTREIAIMKRLNHDSIVKLYKSFDNPHSIHIVMEYVKGKSLYQYLKERPGKRLPEEEAKIIIKQLAEAMQYIHENNVAHRDLKLENIIVNSKTKKLTLIDFGFSITSGHDKKLKIF